MKKFVISLFIMLFGFVMVPAQGYNTGSSARFGAQVFALHTFYGGDLEAYDRNSDKFETVSQSGDKCLVSITHEDEKAYYIVKEIVALRKYEVVFCIKEDSFESASLILKTYYNGYISSYYETEEEYVEYDKMIFKVIIIN